jgi:hypothetical protein
MWKEIPHTLGRKTEHKCVNYDGAMYFVVSLLFFEVDVNFIREGTMDRITVIQYPNSILVRIPKEKKRF